MAQRDATRTGRPSAEPYLVSLGRHIRAARDRGELKSFCDSVPIHTRKAYHLIAIADAVDRGLLQASLVQEIGWAKVQLIAQHANTKAEVRRAVLFARDNTLPAVAAYFKRDGAPRRLITKSFHLTERQAQQLDATLASAGARPIGGRLDRRAEALMRIIRDYSRSVQREPRRPA